MIGKRKTVRWIVRIALLGIFVFLMIPDLVDSKIIRLIPAFSPLVGLAGLLAQKKWLFGIFWVFPPLLIFLLAIRKARFFCRWICPLGTVYEIFSTISLRRIFLKLRLKGFIFWTIIFASLMGIPLLTFLDPLSTFNRFQPFHHFGSNWPLIMFLLMVVPFIILGFIQPMIWCTHLCPLGYSFEFFFKGKKKVKDKVNHHRRQILTGLLIGIPGAILSKRFALGGNKEQNYAILPPGVKDQDSFSAVCTRCYACVHVCPTRVLTVKFPQNRTLGQFFQPELDTSMSYCDESCHDCSKVCPSGAILPLSLELKKNRQIGIARVEREGCLAWADKRFCMVCDEFCPYDAIETSMSNDKIPRPVVDENICRGCGSCQNACPAVRMGKAIRIYGIKTQRQLAAKD